MHNRVHFKQALLAAGLMLLAACVPADEENDKARDRMLREISQSVQHTSSYTGLDAIDPAVLSAMRRVPRHEFVPALLTRRAYENRPLPIGDGQTISQPFIVALMTHLAAIGPQDKVLEIGTGSGYQAAVLAELAGEVYTIEIVASLGQRSGELLKRLHYDNVQVKIGDGYAGWPEHAPFDAIVVTAAPEVVPQPLMDQLKVGGRLVIPVGPQDGAQELKVLRKRDDGSLQTTSVLPVIFVPFTRDP